MNKLKNKLKSAQQPLFWGMCWSGFTRATVWCSIVHLFSAATLHLRRQSTRPAAPPAAAKKVANVEEEEEEEEEEPKGLFSGLFGGTRWDAL